MSRRAMHICQSPVYRLGQWLFEMHSYCGPIRLDKRGEPTPENFGEQHPFWGAFERWQAQGSRVDARGRCIFTWTDRPSSGADKK